ncbi:MAG: hypothetical protein R3253_06450 [Longimicrobiales bacterium]|nr:hypothetical protein [Longimicrobiales bacterium]
MIKKLVMATALLALPLALTPADAAAQERGTERAAAVSAAAANANQAMPAGMSNRPAGKALPPGMLLTRPQPEPEAPGAEQPTEPTEPEGETCLPTFELNPLTGQMELVPCEA